MILVTLSLLLVVLLLFYYYCIRPLNYWKSRGVKQTNPRWLFGDTIKTTFRIQSFPEWFNEHYKKFPNDRYYGLYQYMTPTLVIRDLDLIKHLTVKEFDHFVDHRPLVSEKADPLWANNLFALKGQRWRDMRSILSPAFTSSKMRAMFVLMSESANNFAKFFLEKDEDVIEVEFKDIFTRYCNDIIATTAFGIEVDSLREPDNEFYQMGREATNFSSALKAIKIVILMSSTKISELLHVELFSKNVKRFFYNLVDETVRVREEKNIVRPDMIHLLMQVRKGNVKQESENGTIDAGFSVVQEVHTGKMAARQITNKEIASQAMVFFFGGFDSVSTLMCFIAYELAVNPDIQCKLRKEIRETYAECKGELTYEALLKMKYLDMVVSESLRKWPLASFLDRVCTKAYTIEPDATHENPLHLVPGDLLWFPVYSIHHDEKYYPNPERFDPERFSDENKDKINPNTYLPFGVGPRNCIGSRFALLENKAVLFHILANFEIVPTSKSQIPIQLTKSAIQLSSETGFWFGLKRLEK